MSVAGDTLRGMPSRPHRDAPWPAVGEWVTATADWPRRARTIGLAVLVVVDTAFTSTAIDARAGGATLTSTGGPTTMSGYAVLAALVGLGLAVGVVWRRRWPVGLAVAGSAAVVLFQLGPTVALVGLTSLLALRPVRVAWVVGPLVAAVTARRVWIDIDATPHPDSFWGLFLGSSQSDHTWVSAPLVTLTLLAGSVGLGLWLRTRTQLATARQAAEVGREQVSSLSDQLSRQAERERLAREIHDGLGHNLSILSVHAGALQAMAEQAIAAGHAHAGGPVGSGATTGPGLSQEVAARLESSARVIRESAARSVIELHDLLDLLRHPDDPDVSAPTPTLNDVRRLVEESVAAGMPLVSTVYLNDGEDADPLTAQTAYRVVQELLTNARRHAPGVPVRLDLTGSRAKGSLAIATANHCAPAGRPGSPVSGRPGSGLVGVRERVTRCGGEMSAGLDEAGVFRVSVRLPWRPPPRTPAGRGER